MILSLFRPFLLVCLAAITLSACGLVDELNDLQDEVSELSLEDLEKLPVEAEGETAAAGAKSAIQSAVQDASRAPSSGGSSVASQVNPDARVFEDDDSASAAAFGVLAEDDKTTDEESNDDENADEDEEPGVNEVSDWEGPMKGPDGEDGWYRRTWSYTETYYPSGTSAETRVINYYYYFTSDSAYDFRKGWGGFKGSKIGYAWTSDHPQWNETEGDTRWIMVIEFRQPQTVGGQTLPGAAVGTWDWKIADTAVWSAGSYAKGTFQFYISKLDFHYLGSAEFQQEISDTAVGESVQFDFGGRSESTYEGVYKWTQGYDQNAKQYESAFFGGGAYTYGFGVTVTKTADSRGDVAYAYEASGTYFYGMGQPDASVDYMLRPDYVSDSTDGPGKLWGKADYQGDSSKDGLLYWSDFVSWNRYSATDVPFDHDDDKGDDDDRDDDSGASEYYSRSETLTYNGGAPQEYVYCSAPEIAADCPADSGQQQ